MESDLPQLPGGRDPGRRGRAGGRRGGAPSGGRGRRPIPVRRRMDRDPCRWHRHRYARRRDPSRRRRDLSCRRCGAAWRGRRSELVGSVRRRSPGAGAVRASWRAWAIRQSPTRHRPSRPGVVVAVATGAPRGRRSRHRPRTDGRDLFRQAVGGATQRGRPRSGRHDGLRRRRDPTRRPAGGRDGGTAARQADQRRQGECPRDIAPLAQGGRRGAAPLPERRGDPSAGRFMRDATRHAARPTSTSSSPRTCSATSCRTRPRSSRAASGCSPRRRWAIA